MTLDDEEKGALAELGYALIREGRYDDARGVWEGLAHLAPTDEAPYRALAVIALREQRWEDAAQLATASLGRRPAAAPLLIRAEAMFRTGRYAECGRDLQQIVQAGAAGKDDDEETEAIRRRAAVMHDRLRRLGA